MLPQDKSESTVSRFACGADTTLSLPSVFLLFFSPLEANALDVFGADKLPSTRQTIG